MVVMAIVVRVVVVVMMVIVVVVVMVRGCDVGEDGGCCCGDGGCGGDKYVGCGAVMQKYSLWYHHFHHLVLDNKFWIEYTSQSLRKIFVHQINELSMST